MQKSRIGSRRSTNVRQRANSRIESHVKRRNPSEKPTDFNILRDQNINFDQISAMFFLVTFVRR